MTVEHGDDDYSPSSIKETQGILLTEEWLVKMGFEKQEDGDDHDDWHWYELQVLPDIAFVQGNKKGYLDVFILDHDNIRVQFVHQLQNLYWCLCGEELGAS